MRGGTFLEIFRGNACFILDRFITSETDWRWLQLQKKFKHFYEYIMSIFRTSGERLLCGEVNWLVKTYL